MCQKLIGRNTRPPPFGRGDDNNPDAAPPNVRYVKDNRGIVQDWARNAIVTLVNQGIAMVKTWLHLRL